MKKCRTSTLNLLTGLSLLFSTAAVAQLPEVKVDLNHFGRPEAEVNEPGYTPWPVKSAMADSLTVNGIKFKFTKVGPAGTGLTSNWYKAGLQAPYYARMANDGLTVKDGNAGGMVELRISGLPAGMHTLLTYHNTVDNASTNTFSPIDIHVGGNLVVNNLMPSNRATNQSEVPSSYLQLPAVAGEDVVLLFAADTTGTSTAKNVFINAFELNTSNSVHQARQPFPADNDEHVNADAGSLQLTWVAAPGAVSHDVYFGTDPQMIASANTGSAAFKGNQSDTSWNVSGLYSGSIYYWRVDEINGSGVKTKGKVWYFRPRQLAFTGAEGYGRFARGGRGGKVVEVTNLNDDGPGSLREAITNNIGPRTIVFTVSGIIELQSRLVLSQPYVTIAGQTAPGKGITIRKAPLGITGNDAIVRHLRVRLGAGPTYDGMGLTGADHSIIDHSSISWTIDEAFSSRGAKNITLQRTLISEALNVAGHQNYPAGTAHGYAATIGGSIGSFHHNLLAHCYGRNWSLGGGLDGNAYYTGKLDITNNVVYNWGNRTTDGGAHQVNFVNNYYKPGAGSTFFYALSAQHEAVGLGTQQYYFAGNVMPGHFNESNQEAGRRSVGNVSFQTFLNTPFFESHVNTQSAYNAYKNVLSDIGCNAPVLDQHDQRIVHETLTGTYTYRGSVSGKPGFPDNEQDVGGYEEYPEVTRPADFDSDHDGLPNWWEALHGLNTQSATGDFSDANADTDSDGFTNLDDYLEWMSAPHYTLAVDQVAEINLKSLSRGYTAQPAFTFSLVQNGQVVLTSDSIARFTPSGTGLGSFTFTVTDAEGSSMSRTVGLHVTAAAPLPVTLIRFEAARKNNHEVVVKWKTSQEINNLGFEVLRSQYANGNSWTKVATIGSKAPDGNSATPLEYTFTDANSMRSKTYYRLAQKDKDGNARLTELKMVNGTLSAAEVKVWPVPSRGKVWVSVASLNSPAMLQVFDAGGKKLLQRNISDHSQQELQLTTAGVFMIRIVSAADGSVISTQKITIQP